MLKKELLKLLGSIHDDQYVGVLMFAQTPNMLSPGCLFIQDVVESPPWHDEGKIPNLAYLVVSETNKDLSPEIVKRKAAMTPEAVASRIKATEDMYRQAAEDLREKGFCRFGARRRPEEPAAVDCTEIRNETGLVGFYIHGNLPKYNPEAWAGFPTANLQLAAIYDSALGEPHQTSVEERSAAAKLRLTRSEEEAASLDFKKLYAELGDEAVPAQPIELEAEPEPELLPRSGTDS